MEAHVFVVINVIKKHGSFIPIFSINTNGVGFPYHESSIFFKKITSLFTRVQRDKSVLPPDNARRDKM